jgi:hypothetical protein
MIQITHLAKEFRLREEPEGIRRQLGAIFNPHWRTIRAVDDVSLTICAGEIVGYLGPNGAGKSITINLLTGILYPTSGTVEVNGLVPQQHRTQNAYNIGVVFGQRSQLGWDLPLIEWAAYLFFCALDFWFPDLEGGWSWIPSTFLFPTARYPLHIYGRTLLSVFTFLFPFGFMAYYPVHHFFGLSPTNFPAFFVYLSPLVALVMLAVAYGFWSLGLKHYQSTGA